jgi:hypothetical protein
LAGDRILKTVYVDEAGTSQNDPVLVVVGAIIDADRQAVQIEEYLASIKAKYILAEDRSKVIFHAKDLYNGGKCFDRQKYSCETRMQIFREILAIFPAFGIPLSVSYIIDPEGKNHPDIKHGLAYMLCISRVEEYMQTEGQENEIAMLIAEDGASAKKYVKDAQRIFRDPSDEMMNSIFKKLLPVRHIRETVYFAGKEDSPLLQVADAYAFSIRRHLAGLKHSHVDAFLGKSAEIALPRQTFGHQLIRMRKPFEMVLPDNVTTFQV